MPVANAISLKLNVIARLSFELTYNDAVQNISYNTTVTP